MSKTRIHRQFGKTHYLGPDGRANVSRCGVWIELCKELDDVDDEIKQRVADKNNYTEYHFALESELIKEVKDDLCRICFREELKNMRNEIEA